jgi:hypothetical protein
MGLFGKNTQEKQFDQSLADSAEKNDTTVAIQMRDVPNVGYDSQVSAMLIDVQTKFLPIRFIPMLDKDKKIIIDENGIITKIIGKPKAKEHAQEIIA